jgi:hypothetical protein
MRTVLLSFWRSDIERDLEARVAHLLAKTGIARWLWVVGDSVDDTEAHLRAIAWPGRVTVIRHDTGIVGEDRETRLRRFSRTADAGLEHLHPEADRVLIHESDLRSPRDIAQRLAGERDEAVAGWPTLTIGTKTIFYDTYVYRAQGRHFEAHPPYHAVYRPDQRFAVDSVGSVWSLPAWAVRDGVRGGDHGALGLCAGLRDRGVTILVDPTVPVVQPFALWDPAFRGLGDGPPGRVSPFAVFSTWSKAPA